MITLRITLPPERETEITELLASLGIAVEAEEHLDEIPLWQQQLMQKALDKLESGKSSFIPAEEAIANLKAKINR